MSIVVVQLASLPPHRHHRRLDCFPQSWSRWYCSGRRIATAVVSIAARSCSAGGIAAAAASSLPSSRLRSAVAWRRWHRSRRCIATAVVSTAVHSRGAGGIAAAAASPPPSSRPPSTVAAQVVLQPPPHRHRRRLDCCPQLRRKWYCSRSGRRIATAVVSTAVHSRCATTSLSRGHAGAASSRST